MNESFLYIRGLRRVDHTVFSVTKGQKTYTNQQTGREQPYSSGQQVKRSLLMSICDTLNEPFAPTEFYYQDKPKNGVSSYGEGEVLSSCNPEYPDQLLGGWMFSMSNKNTAKSKTKSEENTDNEQKESSLVYKRRSPLSISAMRPLHPLLSRVNSENLTFDRSGLPGEQTVRVRDSNGRILNDEELQTLMTNLNRSFPPKKYIQDQKRAEGLFVYDIAIDLRRLFSVSVRENENELMPSMIEQLKSSGWIESTNVFGKCLVCPKNRRDKIIPALAHSIINWSITSNQSRTYDPQVNLAVAISSNASNIVGAIRAEIDEEKTYSARPIIDATTNANLFKFLTISSIVPGVSGTANALEDAEKYLIEQLSSFDYEHQ